MSHCLFDLSHDNTSGLSYIIHIFSQFMQFSLDAHCLIEKQPLGWFDTSKVLLFKVYFCDEIAISLSQPNATQTGLPAGEYNYLYLHFSSTLVTVQSLENQRNKTQSLTPLLKWSITGRWHKHFENLSG